ncbi:MAG: hypothetical protein CVU13_00020 [Bacteroidetes bacterium HGW-Bacteroidetes-8]|jgi:hypothetical protein|nr:MAG: hypothetical protein CVU13_00020 [Bacteroidetes bacterium HGW-Bacteroidetes-8]
MVMSRAFTFIASLLVCYTLVAVDAFAQNEALISSENDKSSSYIEFSGGAGITTFRDLATSPLFYNGASYTFTGGHYRLNNRVETHLGCSYSFGLNINNFNNTYKSATFYSLDINYSRLYRVNALSVGRWNTKAGVNLVNTTNIRENEALMNNSLGVENILNIMAASKLTLSVPRIKSRPIKILFIRKILKPAQRELSLSLGLGALNLNYRPGYAYNYLPQITGSEIKNFGDYKLSVNGFRILSRVDYTHYLYNGNGLKLSYLFDTYNAPGKYEPFHFARHSLQLSFLFNYR